MRGHLLVALVGVLLVSGGCADSPTGVAAEGAGPAYENLQGCVTTGVCLVEPIVIGGGGCDPWMDIDWCASDGGSCITSQPGTAPSGDATLATCNLGGGGGGGDSPEDPDDQTGGGGGYPPPDAPACDQSIDPECNQPLTAADSATIRLAIARHRRPASEFTNLAKAEQCEQLFSRFEQLFAAGNVFRGGYDTPAGDPETDTHVGAYDTHSRTMHFEPSALDAANRGDPDAVRNIFNTALHEAAHSLGFLHSEPVLVDGYDLYSEHPFNLLSPGSNSCITNW